MQTSRRAFLGGLAALVAAPAIVRVGSLMRLPKPEIIRAPAISMRMINEYAVGDNNLISRLDVFYGNLYVRPEWTVNVPEILTLNDYSARIINPMIEKFAAQQRKIFENAVMNGSSGGDLVGLLRATSPLE